MTLHITNGDNAGEMLQQAATLCGAVLCWRDLLHDGPVPHRHSLELHQSRARFLAGFVSAPNPFAIKPMNEETIVEDFIQRDQQLDSLSTADEVILWFEHDLYDQLQIAQCLYEIDRRRSEIDLSKCSMICIGSHPEVDHFYGLGDLSIQQLEALYPQRKPITDQQLREGVEVWQAITQPSAEPLQTLLQAEFHTLPYMNRALERFAAEFPHQHNGLTLTQIHILQSLASPLKELPKLKQHLHRRYPTDSGAADQHYQRIMNSEQIKFGRLFANLQTLEESVSGPFQGDLIIAHEIYRLANASTPYVNIENPNGEWDLDSHYRITDAGREALNGNRHWLEENAIDLWRGGIHNSSDHCYVWASHEKSLKRYQPSDSANPVT